MYNALFLQLNYACLRIGDVAVSHTSNHTIRVAAIYVSGLTRLDKISLGPHFLFFRRSVVSSKLLLPLEMTQIFAPRTLVKFLEG